MDIPNFAMDAFWAAPPVIRTITLLTVVTSVAVYAGLLDAYLVIFYPPLIFTLKKFPPQLWRFFSSFWLTGPKLGMIFDPYFLYSYGSLLEFDTPRFSRRGDFMMYIIFVEVLVVALCGGILGGMVFLPALILAFAFTYSQDNANSKTQFFILTIQTRYLPYCILALTFVMGGPTATYQQATGLIAAHAYDFLTRIWPTFGGGRNWIEWATPDALRRAFGEGVAGQRTSTTRGYGVAYSGQSAGGQASQGQGAGRSTGFSNPLSSWGQRGSGRRLGGD